MPQSGSVPEIEPLQDLLLEFRSIEHAAVRTCGKPCQAVAKRVVNVVAVAGIQEEVVAGVDHLDARIVAKDVLKRLQSDMPRRIRRTIWLALVLHVAIEILPEGNGRLRVFHVPDEFGKRGDEQGGKIGAICASPAVVLGNLGLLAGRNAVCYPGMEETVEGVNWGKTQVAVDGNIVTGNGPAAAAPFALTMVSLSMGEDKAREVASGMLLEC